MPKNKLILTEKIIPIRNTSRWLTVPTYKGVHVIKEHILTPECWCRPRRTYKDKKTGAEVWVHHIKPSKRKKK